MFEEVTLIDLTHTIDESIPTWGGGCGFCYEVKKDYEQGVRVLKYQMHAACGTHMDAPSHFIKGKEHIADIDLKRFFTPCVIIDISKKRKESLWLLPEDVKEYEKNHGKIKKNSLVIGYTGWQEFWHDPLKYRNEKPGKKLSFPGFSKDAAELLLDRDIAGIGIDTLSPDGSDMKEFPVHHLILGAGKYILENLCNLHLMPASGGFAVTLPMKIKEGSESAVRCVGLIKK